MPTTSITTPVLQSHPITDMRAAAKRVREDGTDIELDLLEAFLAQELKRLDAERVSRRERAMARLDDQ